jgi:hypothetical protein
VSLVWTVACKGFIGSKLVGFLLTLPLIVFILGANLSLGRSGDRTPFRIRSKGTIFLLVEIVSLCWLGFGLLYPFRWLFLKVSKQ